MLRVLAASTALVASGAQAQYGSGRSVIGLPPSVELNLDVLTKLRPPPVQEMRKVPSEQPYAPPVRLPASAPSPSSVATRALPAMPFARGESPANILSDVSSARPVQPAPKPVERPVVKAPAPARVAPPVAAPAPKPPVQAVPAPVAPRPVAAPVTAPKPIIPAPAAPAPVAQPQPIVPPPPVTSAPQPTSIVPPINNAPMMIPVTPRTAPAPLVPREIPVQTVPEAKPAMPLPAKITPPAPAAVMPLPTGNVPPLAPVTMPVAAPAPVIPPAPVSAPPAAAPQPLKPAAPVSAIPPLVPVTTTAKTMPNVPPAPSLDGLDFSNMKASTDPDGLGDLTPQKLLGKPVETMVVNRTSTIPEIEVPAATMSDKLPTVSSEKKDAGMLPSISNRVDKLFTKDDAKIGVTNDTTRVLNPVADKQKELAAKKAEITPPKLPAAKDAGLPPLPLPIPEPKEKSIKIAPTAPSGHTLKVIPEKSVGLPSLDAITGDKAAPSSMDIVEPKDGIIARETMPPAKLPEPIPALPTAKKEAAPKVVVEEKKPTPPAPVKEVVKEVPKLPPAAPSPLAITPKVKPNIKEDTKIAALPPLPDFGAGMKKPDPALAPALPQLPPPAKLEAKKPEPVIPAKPITPPEVEVKAPAPKVEPAKPAAPLSVPKPPSSAGGKPSASIGFTKDATDLSPDAKTELMDLASSIKSNDSSVRIVAYAKGSEDEASVARRISLSRALQVRAFLIDKGVNQLKINVQALGHKVPSGNADRADVVVY